MLKFLFRSRQVEAKIETQRDRFARLVEELNAAIDALPDKPRVTVDPATGHILPETPEQFPDEALALPKPDAEAAKAAPPVPTGTEIVPPAPQPPKPRAPVPKPPVPKGPGPQKIKTSEKRYD